MITGLSLAVGTLGQLLIVEAFTFYIWLKVLLDTIKSRDGSLTHKKMLLTSVGLVLNALCIFGIMSVRLYQVVTENWPYVWPILALMVGLSISNFMFILSASIGTSARILKVFIGASAVWTVIVFVCMIW